jgi:hypothetical protein
MAKKPLSVNPRTGPHSRSTERGKAKWGGGRAQFQRVPQLASFQRVPQLASSVVVAGDADGKRASSYTSTTWIGRASLQLLSSGIYLVEWVTA